MSCFFFSWSLFRYSLYLRLDHVACAPQSSIILDPSSKRMFLFLFPLFPLYLLFYLSVLFKFGETFPLGGVKGVVSSMAP